MPRKTHSQHPDHVRTTSSQQPPAAHSNDAPKAHHSEPHQSPLVDPSIAYKPLYELLRRDDGWLRVVPDADGKLVWWKWKITRGKWSGHYLMVRGFVERHDEAMDILSRKLHQVDLGYERPTRDSYYDQG